MTINPADVLAGISVRQLRWILHSADNDLTLGEAVEGALEAERRAEADNQHTQRQLAYHAYLRTREERGTTEVAEMADAAKQKAIRDRPISVEDAAVVRKEAADLQRLRFEIHEPRLTFEEWVEAGQPPVYRTGPARAKAVIR